MIPIVEAAHVPNCAAAAAAYARLGLCVIPLVGKRPVVNWRSYMHHKPTAGTMAAWHATGLFRNVGIVCGAVSGNLVVIDLDGLNAVNQFTRRFPTLMGSYSVKTGSGLGLHVYLYVTQLGPTLKASDIPGGGNIELRSTGSCVAAPPSRHPDTGAPYVVSNQAPIQCLPNLTEVRDWMRSLKPSQPGGARANVQRDVSWRAKGFGYAAAALRSEVEAVLRSGADNHNNTLNRAAYSLGQLVADGALDRTTAEAELLAAAQKVGQTDYEAKATIKSGMEAGMRNPRSRRHG